MDAVQRREADWEIEWGVRVGVGGDGGPPDTSEPPAALSDPAPLAWSLLRLPAGRSHRFALPPAILPLGWEKVARSRTKGRALRRDLGAD